MGETPRAVATTTARAAPIVLSLYDADGLAAAVELGPRDALALAVDVLRLVLAKGAQADAPAAAEPGETVQ